MANVSSRYPKRCSISIPGTLFPADQERERLGAVRGRALHQRERHTHVAVEQAAGKECAVRQLR